MLMWMLLCFYNNRYKLCEGNDPARFSVLPEVCRNLRCSISPLKFNLICVGDKRLTSQKNCTPATLASAPITPGLDDFMTFGCMTKEKRVEN